MKFLVLHIKNLRNAEHFQLMTEFRDLIAAIGAVKLNINKLFVFFLSLIDREDECLLFIRKSHYTKGIREENRMRDLLFRGLYETVEAATRHFDAQKAEAGRLLKILFDTYGNLAKKPADEKTASIFNLLQELEGNYAAQVQEAGVGDWIAELKLRNAKYDGLVKNRDAESAGRARENMVAVRKEIDEQYRRIIQAVESLLALCDNDQEAANYQRLIGEMNAVIVRYKARLTQRAGKGKNKTGDAVPVNDEIN